jgi:hypothetical protein
VLTREKLQRLKAGHKQSMEARLEVDAVTRTRISTNGSTLNAGG